jgi:hypothetical protein
MAGSPIKRMRRAGITDPITGELVPFPYMPRVADLPPGWRHFSAAQKIEHLIGLDRCYEILSWPLAGLDPVHLSMKVQVIRIVLRICVKAMLDGTLGRDAAREHDRERGARRAAYKGVRGRRRADIARSVGNRIRGYLGKSTQVPGAEAIQPTNFIVTDAWYCGPNVALGSVTVTVTWSIAPANFLAVGVMSFSGVSGLLSGSGNHFITPSSATSFSQTPAVALTKNNQLIVSQSIGDTSNVTSIGPNQVGGGGRLKSELSNYRHSRDLAATIIFLRSI